MDDKEYIFNEIKALKERLANLELDLQDQKLSNVEVRVKLSSIEASQEQIKSMINESSRENNKMTVSLLEMIKENTDAQLRIQSENNSTSNNIKISDRKEIWTILGLIIGGILAYLGLK